MATTSRAGKQKGSAHPNVEAAVRGWQTHEYANAGAAADAPERGNNHLYEEMYPGDDAKTARRKYHRLINAQVRKPEVIRSEKPEEPVPVNVGPKRQGASGTTFQHSVGPICVLVRA